MQTAKLSTQTGRSTASKTTLSRTIAAPSDLQQICDTLVQRADAAIASLNIESKTASERPRHRYSHLLTEASYDEEIEFIKYRKRQLRLQISTIRSEFNHPTRYGMSTSQGWQALTTIDMEAQADLRIQVERKNSMAAQYRHVLQENQRMRNLLEEAEQLQQSLKRKLENRLGDKLKYLQRQDLEQQYRQLQELADFKKKESTEFRREWSYEYKQKIVKLEVVEDTLEEQDEYLRRLLELQRNQLDAIDELQLQLDNRTRASRPEKSSTFFQKSKQPESKFRSEHHSRSIAVHPLESNGYDTLSQQVPNQRRNTTTKSRLQLAPQQLAPQSQPHLPSPPPLFREKQQNKAAVVSYPSLKPLPKAAKSMKNPIEKQPKPDSSSSDSSDEQTDQRLFKPIKIEKEVIVLPRQVPEEEVECISSDSDIFQPTKISQRKVKPNITIEEVRIFPDQIHSRTKVNARKETTILSKTPRREQSGRLPIPKKTLKGPPPKKASKAQPESMASIIVEETEQVSSISVSRSSSSSG